MGCPLRLAGGVGGIRPIPLCACEMEKMTSIHQSLQPVQLSCSLSSLLYPYLLSVSRYLCISYFHPSIHMFMTCYCFAKQSFASIEPKDKNEREHIKWLKMPPKCCGEEAVRPSVFSVCEGVCQHHLQHHPLQMLFAVCHVVRTNLKKTWYWNTQRTHTRTSHSNILFIHFF